MNNLNCKKIFYSPIHNVMPRIKRVMTSKLVGLLQLGASAFGATTTENHVVFNKQGVSAFTPQGVKAVTNLKKFIKYITEWALYNLSTIMCLTERV